MRPGGSRPSLRKATVVFKHRNYRYLWFSSLFAFTGMQMQQVARALLAWELTESYGAVGAVSLSFGLPMLMFSLIGGSLADRFEKRNLTLMTQSVTSVLALLTAILVFTDSITIQILLAIGFVQGIFFAFGMPARTPLMADAVGRENVMSAIAMSNAAMNATRLFAPAVAGVMVVVWGLSTAFFAQAVVYVLSCLVILRVPTGISEAANAGMARQVRGNMFVEIGRGLRYASTDPQLRTLFATLFIVTFFAMPYVMLLAGFVHEDLGRGDGAFGVLQSASGAGALVGAIGIATLTEFDRKPMLQWAFGLVGGASLVALAFSAGSFGFAGALIATVVLGFAFTAYQTLNNTMVMDAAKPEYYGRIMSINMLTFSAMPIMAYPLGAIADHLGAQTTFTSMGLIVLGSLLLMAFLNPRYTFGRDQRPAAFEVAPAAD
ncbi:MAG: MFS transporter [Tepidiformaceae bacterium]